jgi:hypothetical protein
MGRPPRPINDLIDHMEQLTFIECGTPCDHSWDGPHRQIIDDGHVTGEEATCSKCGAGAFEVALMEDE